MTPDELRALADALEPMAKAPRFKDFDVPAFCEWVRACADGKPVAWIVEHGPTRRLTFFDEAPGKVGAGVSIPLYTHPAPPTPQADIGRLRECAQRLVDGARWNLAGALSPSSKAREIPSSAWSDVKSRHLASLRDALAAPQAEPCIGNDPMCPCQDGDACHYKDSADGTKAWPVPQSEPKRKDQSMRDLLAIIHCDGGHHTEAVGLDQSIKDAQAAVYELKGRLAMEMREPGSEPTEAQIEYEILCNGEWVAGANGPGAEAEILHYLTHYEQDGPCEVYAVTRRLVDRAALAVKETK